MEYVDSEYRTEYANCLPFEDIQGSPYSAIVYLGKGEDWFPVIPKYRNLVSLIKDNVGIVFAGEGSVLPSTGDIVVKYQSTHVVDTSDIIN